jgi:hypothetical protein
MTVGMDVFHLFRLLIDDEVDRLRASTWSIRVR